MNKVKYRLIGRSVYEEENCLNMLEREAASGWMLDKVGTIFFRFKRAAPTQRKFFMNFYRPTGGEIHHLEDQGYNYLGSCQKVSFLYSDNLDIREPSYNADYKAMAVKEVFSIFRIGALFVLALLVVMLFNYNGIVALLTRNSLAGYLLNFQRLLLHFVGMILAVSLVMTGIEMVFVRIKYARLATGDNPRIIGYRIFKLLHNISIIALVLLLGFGAVLLGLNNPKMLGYLFILVVIWFVFQRIYNKLVIMDNARLRRYLKPAAIIIYIIILTLARIPNIHSHYHSGNKASQAARYNYTINENALLYHSIGYFGTQEPVAENIEYLSEYKEIRYFGITDFLAQEIFRFKVEDLEHRSRGWSDLDQLLLEAGGTKPLLEYPSYQEATISLEPIDSKKIDAGYQWEDHYVILKDRMVLEVELDQDLAIADLIDYYLS